MDIKRALPRGHLRAIIRSFEQRTAEPGNSVLAWPVAARPHQVLIIHLAEPYRVRIDGGGLHAVPEVGIVGPQSRRRAHVYLSGSIEVFTILFQPTGLHQLVGINMATLVDQDPPASDVLGRAADTMREAVCRAPNFQARVAAVEYWAQQMLEKRRPDDIIGVGSRTMLTARGDVRIARVIANSGLSASQFQRRFSMQVGMSPKLFARTIRFDSVLRAHRQYPNKPWTDIIHEFGYFDQAHFIRDCRAFAGLPPHNLTGDWDNVFLPGA